MVRTMKDEIFKVLPNEYDNSISYYEVLTKVVDKLNVVIDKLDNIGPATDIQYSQENERIIIYEKEIA